MNSPVWGFDAAVTQPFGCTDLTLEPFWALCLSKHFHCGIDIALNTGTPLRAARSGVVSQVGYGFLAIQVGAETDWYVHIDSAVVGQGTAVTTHQLIAYSGAKVPSGGSLTGPHLHFERQSGRLNFPATALDPEPILAPTFGPGGGSTGDNDLTPQEHVALEQIQHAVMGGYYVDTAGNDVTTALWAAINKRFGRSCGVLPVTGRYVVTADQHLAVGFDPHLHSREGRTHGVGVASF